MTVAISSPTEFAKLRSAVAAPSVFAKFLSVAVLGAAADVVTKALASNLLTDGRIQPLTDRLSLMLVYNTGGAGGVTIGPFTGFVNVLVTLIAIAMVVRIVKPLAAVDSRSVMALGLVTGGAIGNLASMLFGPKGVADFLALRLTNTTSIVLNFADVLLWTGALLLVPVVLHLVSAVLAERKTR